MEAGASAGCSGADCEGEEQEDPSSSSADVPEVNDAVRNLNIEDNQLDELSAFRQQWQQELAPPASAEEKVVGEDEPPPFRRSSSQIDDYVEDELSAFRLQWQRELEATPTPQRETGPDEEPSDDEERAKKFFLKGAELERGGKLYEAVQQYKKAMAIVPDIEIRLYESTKGMETPREESEPEVAIEVSRDEDEDEVGWVPGEDVAAHLLRVHARSPVYCQPAIPTKEAHISWLPFEVLYTVLRWVVSSELDAASLERVGATCRALHLAARAQDLWRAICVQTWGIECGTPRGHEYSSWREMYIKRARLLLHGCYISKTTYLRPGENSFQDHCYRPWYLIDYYRYLRFFSDGTVLMWTTADEPVSCVGLLRTRQYRPGVGIMAGHYRLVADKVVIVIKKISSEKKLISTSNTRFRSRRKDPELEQTQTFHLELELRHSRGRRNAVLSWRGYSVVSRQQWTHFELTPPAFPPFSFSPVRSYTRRAYSPL